MNFTAIFLATVFALPSLHRRLSSEACLLQAPVAGIAPRAASTLPSGTALISEYAWRLTGDIAGLAPMNARIRSLGTPTLNGLGISGNTIVSPAGTWQRQGIVLTPSLPTDFNNFAEPSLVADTSGVLIPNATNVLKMWFTVGGFGNPVGIAYAESTNGIDWTRRPERVLDRYYRSCVFKDARTYRLYAVPSEADIDARIDSFKSLDGINWTLDKAGVLTVGDDGEWDHDRLENCWVLHESTGVWKMLYEARPDASASWQLGLATSADGVTWRKSGFNPVIPSGADPWFFKSGETYHLVYNAPHYGGSALLPTAIWSSVSSNLVTWTRLGTMPLLTRATLDEGMLNNLGQVVDPALVEWNDQTWLAYIGATNGTLSGASIKMLTANARLADLFTNVTDDAVAINGNIAMNGVLWGKYPIRLAEPGAPAGIRAQTNSFLSFGINISEAVPYQNDSQPGGALAFSINSAEFPVRVITRPAGSGYGNNRLALGIDSNAIVRVSNALWAQSLMVTNGITNAVVGASRLLATDADGKEVAASLGSGLTFIDGTLSIARLTGSGPIPAIEAGAGAGTPSAVRITGTDTAGRVTIETGPAPAPSAIIITVTFARPYANAPYVVTSPAGASASALGFMPYIECSATAFTLNSGSVPLGASTTYLWNYHVIQ